MAGRGSVRSTLGGEFADPDLERAFRASSLDDCRAQFARMAAAAALAFALFAPMDLLMAPAVSQWPTWMVTGSRAAVLAAALLLLRRLPGAATPSRLERLQLGFVAVFMAAAAVVYYIAAARVAGGEVASDSAILDWSSLYVVLTLSFLAFPMRFGLSLAFNALAAAVLVTASLLPAGEVFPAALGRVLLAVVVSAFGALLLRQVNILRRRHFEVLQGLTASETAVRRLFMAVPVPLGLTRLSDGKLVKANAAGYQMFGYTPEAAAGLSAEQLYVDPTRRHALVDAVRRDGGVQNFEAEMTLADGCRRILLLSATRVEYGGEQCIMTGATDITERKEYEQSLIRLASTDQLTGLANRHHFFSLSSSLQARARRFGEPLAVLMMDLDHFKSINDSHGHDAGDLVLVTFAEMCRGIFRESDVVARMGGEEFAVLLPATDLAGGLQVAERLRERVADYLLFPRSGEPIHFTVSIGVAELEPEEADLEHALMRADRALYHAKRTGRNCVGCTAERQDMSA